MNNEPSNEGVMTGKELTFHTRKRQSTCVLGDLIGEGDCTQVYASESEEYGSLAVQVYMRHIRPENSSISKQEQGEINRRRRAGLLLIDQQHKGLVDVLGMGTLFLNDYQGIPSVVMRRVEGENLEDILKRENFLDPIESLDIVMQVMEVLIALQRNGFIHRQVSVKNIIYRRYANAKPERRGNVTLAGCGKLREVASAPKRAVTQHFPMEKILTIPQEQDIFDEEHGRPFTEKDEIFTVGWLLYTLIEGVEPYCSKTGDSLEIMTRIMYDSFRGIQRQDLSRNERQWLTGLTGKMLALRKEAQYKSLIEVYEDIQRTIRGLLKNRPLPIVEQFSEKLPEFPPEASSDNRHKPIAQSVPAEQTRSFPHTYYVDDEDEPEQDFTLHRTKLPAIVAAICIIIVAAILLSPLRLHIIGNNAVSRPDGSMPQQAPTAKKKEARLKFVNTRITPCALKKCFFAFYDAEDTSVFIDEGRIIIKGLEYDEQCQVRLHGKYVTLALSVKGDSMFLLQRKKRCTKNCPLFVRERIISCRYKLQTTWQRSLSWKMPEDATVIGFTASAAKKFDIWHRIDEHVGHITCIVNGKCKVGLKKPPSLRYRGFTFMVKNGSVWLKKGLYQAVVKHHLDGSYSVTSIAVSKRGILAMTLQSQKEPAAIVFMKIVEKRIRK